MKRAPIRNKNIFTIMNFGTENSSTITSEQDIYVNVPAARDMNIISMIGLVPETIIPMTTPIGVARANKIMRITTKVI